jgi:outer membrane protein OmpA-like peptidoglycan-associated protein
MLAHVYFDADSSEIPERYIRLKSQAATLAFDEHKLRGTIEKYHHLLNIIGKRMTDNPLAPIRLVGCNSNTGAERGRKDLSRLRAESIKAYLQYIWGIDPARLQVEARNLPQAPSTSRLEAGQAENQRVEIYSEDSSLLDVIRSLYVEADMDTRELVVRPRVEARHGVDRWSIRVAADNEILKMLQGRDAPASDYPIALDAMIPAQLAAFEQIAVTMDLQDKEGHTLQVAAEPVDIRFIRKKELMAQNLGYKVEEKYALILFDFDSADIKERNQVVVDRIVERIRSLPQTTVEIVGHTDIIGKEDYNLELSERRAKAVYEQLVTTFGEGVRERIAYSGKGPFDPLYDNDLPEGRALNRTVTITLEYEARSQ